MPKPKEDFNKLYQNSIDKTIATFQELGLVITFIQELNFGQKYRFDYFSPELGLAIEFEGGRGRGGHTMYNRYMSDMAKYNLAAKEGYYFLRFTYETLNQVPSEVFGFYMRRSKVMGGTIHSPRIEKLDKYRIKC